MRNPNRVQCIFASKVNNKIQVCEMKRIAMALALAGSCVLGSTVISTPAFALETFEAQMQATDAASQARLLTSTVGTRW
jgi:hypothetical protein